MEHKNIKEDDLLRKWGWRIHKRDGDREPLWRFKSTKIIRTQSKALDSIKEKAEKYREQSEDGSNRNNKASQ